MRLRPQSEQGSMPGMWHAHRESLTSQQRGTQLVFGIMIHLKIEGIHDSGAINDVNLTATFVPSGGYAAADRVNLTVSSVKVDVDSNNNDGFNVMRDSDAKIEGELEQDQTAVGKYVGIN